MEEYWLGAKKPNLVLCSNTLKDKSLNISGLILSDRSQSWSVEKLGPEYQIDINNKILRIKL